MKRAFLIVAIIGGLFAAGAAIADTCETDCWTDLAGNQHCTTRCSQY